MSQTSNVNRYKPSRVIRRATLSDLSYLYDLQSTMHHAVGYTPRGGIEDRINTNRIIVVEENGWPAGFINFTHRKDRRTHVSQLAVDPAIWRTAAGTEIMTRILNDARHAGSVRVTLRTALDLDANQFWPTVGFGEVGTEQPLKRILVCWEHDLHIERNALRNVHGIPSCRRRPHSTPSTVA